MPESTNPRLNRLSPLGDSGIIMPVPKFPKLSRAISTVLTKPIAEAYDAELERWSEALQNILIRLQQWPQLKDWEAKIAELSSVQSDVDSAEELLTSLQSSLSTAQSDIVNNYAALSLMVGEAKDRIYTLEQGSPLTTRGDLLTRDSTQNVRLGIGANNTFLFSNGTDPSWQAITASVITAGAALTRVDDTNVTLTLGGSPSTALLAATSLTLGWSGQLAIARGGHGASTALGGFNALSPLTTRGDLLTRDASNNVRLAVGGVGTFLKSDGTDPSWAFITVSDISSGVLALVNGGTSKALTAVAGGLVWSDADSLEITAAGTSGYFVRSGGTSTPTFFNLFGTSNTWTAMQSFSSINGLVITANTGVITTGTWNGSPITVPYGGTGAITLTGMLKGNGTSAFTAITGTGSFVPKWSDANTLSGTSLIYDTGSVVGIGIDTAASSSYRLHIGGVENVAFIGIGDSARLRLGHRNGVDTGLLAAQIHADDEGYIHFATRGNNASGMRFFTYNGSSLAQRMELTSGGNLGLGVVPSAKYHVLATTEQLRLGYDASNYSSFTVSSSGNLTLAPSGGSFALTGNQSISGLTASKWVKTDVGKVLTSADIAASDIVSGAALTRVDDTNVTLTLGGTPSASLLAATSLTLGWSGQLAISRGGTSASTALGAFNALSPLTTRGDLLTRDASNNVRLAIGSSGKFLKTDGTDPSWQTIVASDIASGAALTKTDDTNVTLTLGGSHASALLAAASLTLGWTGQLSVARGGTGAGTLTGILKGNGTSAVTALTGTTGYHPKWSDANTLSGTSLIWENGTNLVVGAAAITDASLKFDVIGDTRVGGWLYVDRTSGTLAAYYAVRVRGAAEEGSFSNALGNGQAEILSNGPAGLIVGTLDSKPLAFGTANTERMRILSDGKVGVGVTPTTKFEVAGRIHAYDGATGPALTVAYAQASGNLISMQAGNTGAASYIYSDYVSSEGPLVLGTYTNRLNQIYMGTNGNVGITTLSPAAKLEVTHSSTNAFRITNANVAHGITYVTATSSVFNIANASSSTGGAYVQGLNSASSFAALFLQGVHGVADPTDNVAAIVLAGGKKNGASITTLGASETVLQIAHGLDGGTVLATMLGSGFFGLGATPTQALHVVGAGYFTTGLGVGDTNITSGVVNVGTGFRIANAAASGKLLKGNGANFVSADLSEAEVALALPTQAGHAGEFLTTNGTNLAWSGVTPGTGTVTSVALTVPSILSVSGSPITTNGTFAVSLATQVANKVFAGPTNGADAAPTFRTLVLADHPANLLTFAKLQQIATAKVLGRTTAGTGDIEELGTLPTAVQDNITRLGTIASGVWNGTDIAVADGGTGASTANAGLNNLLPSQATHAGKFLQTDGTNTSWVTVAGGTGTVTSFTDNDIATFAVSTVANPTTSPTVSWDLVDADANKFWAGPTSGAAADPTYRVLHVNDFSANLITFAKVQQIATARILGRNTASTGDIEELTASTVKTMLSLNNVENTALSTWAGSTNLTTLGTITEGVWSGTDILFSKIEQIATASILGRTTASTGDIEVLSVSSVRTLLSINNVENTALSTWAGSTNLTTLGTIGTGVWNATTITVGKGGTGLTTGTSGGIPYFESSSQMQSSAALTEFAVVLGGGAGEAPYTLGNNTTTTKKYLTQTGNGTQGLEPAWATISASEIGSGAALTKSDDTNVTLTLGGSHATALLAAASLTLGWTGSLAAGRGGTGFTSYTDGQLLIGNTATGLLSRSALTGSSTVLVTNGNGSIALSVIPGGLNVYDLNGGLPADRIGDGFVSDEAFNEIAGIDAITATAGIICRNASGDWAARTLTAASSKISITNGTGASANPTVDVTEANLNLANLGGTLGTNHGGTGLTAIGSALQVLRTNAAGTALEWANPGTGTVTSVALSAPSFLTVGGSPVTTSGTLALSLASQSQNLVFASPNGSSGAPDFRALVAADLPTVTVPKGGTGQTTYTDGQLLIGNSTGNTLTKATLTEGDNISITNAGGSITIGVTGVPTSAYNVLSDGSNNSIANGNSSILFGTANNLLSIDVTPGVSAVGPVQFTVNEGNFTLNNIGGTLGPTKGGTGLTSGVAGGIPYFESSTQMQSSAALAEFGVVIGGGPGEAPYTLAQNTTTTKKYLSQTGNGSQGLEPAWGLVDVGSINASGIDDAKYLRGDGTWAVPAGGGDVLAPGGGFAADRQRLVQVTGNYNVREVPDSINTSGGGLAIMTVGGDTDPQWAQQTGWTLPSSYSSVSTLPDSDFADGGTAASVEAAINQLRDIQATIVAALKALGAFGS